jgi:hypothetical protein
MKCLALLCLLATPVIAQPSPPLSLTNCPDGIDRGAWKDIWQRSQRVGQVAAKYVRGANADCIAATALDILAWAEVSTSSEARSNPASEMDETVRKGKGSKVRRSVRRHRDDTCKGNGGPPGSATATDLEALLKFASNNDEWQTSNPDKWRMTADAIRAAFAAGLGVGADVAESAAQMLPIVNPCAVAPRLSICSPREHESL